MRSILEEVQSYEITSPTWLHPLRHRRSANKEVSQAGCFVSFSGLFSSEIIFADNLRKHFFFFLAYVGHLLFATLSF